MKRLFYFSVMMSCAIGLAGERGNAQTRRRSSNSRPPFVRCQYKTIAVPGENGENQMLSFSSDLKRLAATMKSNRAYEVSEHYNGDGVIISRTFKGVKYNIIFENRGSISFNLNTYNFKGYPNGTVAWGERCGTPHRLIRRKVYLMIEDLPFDIQQKAELKRYVLVTNAVNGRLF
jgi:hypothetical protein